jgi:hypothetical protein
MRPIDAVTPVAALIADEVVGVTVPVDEATVVPDEVAAETHTPPPETPVCEQCAVARVDDSMATVAW